MGQAAYAELEEKFDMPETVSAIASLTRDVASLREELRSMRGELVRICDANTNDLHRHQDDDREDFKSVHGKVETLKSTIDGWNGGMQLLKLITIPCTLIAAVAGLVNLIRHW